MTGEPTNPDTKPDTRHEFVSVLELDPQGIRRESEGQKGGIIPNEEKFTPFTPERLAGLNTLSLEVQADFARLLDAINHALGTDEAPLNLQPRGESFHITIIGPVERQVLSSLDSDQVAELNVLGAKIQRGEGIALTGIGYIDGSSTEYNLSEADQTKKVAFLTVDVPELNAFRQKLGLPAKDFHVTLGFEGGDIHGHITGYDNSGKKPKAIKEPIPKRPNADFNGFPFPPLTILSLGGNIQK